MTMSIIHTKMRFNAGSLTRTGLSASVRAAANAVGFAALFCWVLLREGFLGSDGATLYNYLPYTALGQIAVLVVLGLVGLRCAQVRLPRLLVAAAVVAGSVSGIVGFALPAPLSIVWMNAAALAVLGGCQSLLGVAWGVRLSGLPARQGALSLSVGMLIAVLGALACVDVGNALCAWFGIVLPIVSGLGLLAGVREGLAQEVRGAAACACGAEAPRMPALLLLALAVQASALFTGMTSYPFAMQSQIIMQWWLLASFAVFAVACVLFLQREQVALSVLMPLTFVLLFVGLFLLYARLLESVIFPLGVVLAGRTCCVGLGWFCLVMLARSMPKRTVAVVAFGSLALNGTVGCALGVLVNNWMRISFNDVALGAAVAVVVFLAAYVVMQARQGVRHGAAVVDAGEQQEPKGRSEAAFGSEGQPAPGGRHAVALNQANALRPQSAEPQVTGADAPSKRWARGYHMALAPQVEAFLDGLKLTQDEHDVAALICERATYEQIANATHMSLRTVKYRAGAIYKKAHVQNRRAFEQLIRDREQ